MTLDNDDLLYCDICENDIKIDQYIVKCDHNDCNSLHFCDADCWVSHSLEEHADRSFGYVNQKGELYFNEKHIKETDVVKND